MSSMPAKFLVTIFYILLVSLPVHMSPHDVNIHTKSLRSSSSGHRSKGTSGGSTKGCNHNNTTPCQKSTNIQAVPAPTPTPLVFADQRLQVVYPIIQKFKSSITSDPLGVTNSWVGSDICSYKGFYCDTPPDNSSATALASIDFNGFQLAASTLDGFIDNLPDIALFHANSNNFGGTISPQIAKIPYLYELFF